VAHVGAQSTNISYTGSTGVKGKLVKLLSATLRLLADSLL